MLPIVPLVKGLGKFCVKNSRKILVGVSVTGAVGSVALAIKAAPRARDVMEDLHACYGKHIPPKVLLSKIGPIYAPTAIVLMTTCGCIIGGHRLANKENAILASIAAGAQGTVAEYEKKLADVLGEKAAKDFKADLAEKRLEALPERDAKYLLPDPMSGDFQLYKESKTGQYFWATEKSLNDAVMRANRRTYSEMWYTLNDWLYEIDVDRTDPDIGDIHAWNVDHPLAIYTRPGKANKGPYAGKSYLLVCYEEDPVLYK